VARSTIQVDAGPKNASLRAKKKGTNMKRTENLIYFFVAIFIFNFSLTHTAYGQEPAGPTKPVLIVNTPAQPVPVSGIISGNVTLSGTSNVNVTNTPTVRIDPGSNAVVVAPHLTQLLLNTGIYDLSVGGFPPLAPINVASYSKIRVFARNDIDSDGYFSMTVGIRLPTGLFISLDSVSLDPGDSFNRVYEVPGQTIQILVGGNGPKRNALFAVFGN
jgi:hypothetical protein